MNAITKFRAKTGTSIGVMLREAIKGFCFVIGVLAASKLAMMWVGV